ncbi:craniofacial development protein 2-like [Saccostrea cucullata]|uniref:craniofacial development protein 2-like n=1 Tax=Saccostrea cuccullata TaxID=36930 RepID=UPI002ED238A8
MKDGSQTQQETDTQIVNILHPKEVCRVGCWNVRTLYQTGKLAQVLKEMDRYDIQMLGICETRRTGNGTRKLATGHQILYLGRSDEQHSSDVGLILNRKLGKCMLGWNPYNDRLLSTRFHSKFAKLTVIVCYSPTEDKEEEKNSFYEELQRAVEETPVHDVLIIRGDLNAKIGTNNEGKESIMGKHGCDVINNNGSRLVDFCLENKLLEAPSSSTKTSINKHGLHQMVTHKIKLTMYRLIKGGELEVKNRFTILKDEQELSIEQFNTALVEAGKKTLGLKKKKKEELISSKTWEMVELRCKTKKKILTAKSARL